MAGSIPPPPGPYYIKNSLVSRVKRKCSWKNSIEEMGAGKLGINVFGVGGFGRAAGQVQNSVGNF